MFNEIYGMLVGAGYVPQIKRSGMYHQHLQVDTDNMCFIYWEDCDESELFVDCLHPEYLAGYSTEDGDTPMTLEQIREVVDTVKEFS